MATPINAAAMQALPAYGGLPRSGVGAGEAAQAFEHTGRETVRHGFGVTVEFSADARASLIAVQSTASAGASVAGSPAPAPDPSAPYEVPGSRLNLTI